MNDLFKKISIIAELKKQVINWEIPIFHYFGLRKKEDVVEFKNGTKCIIRDKSDSIAFFEVFFLNTNDYIDEFKIKERDVVVDIGAHVGYFSIHSALNAKDGKVLAFEPYEESFEILMKNLKINQINNVIPQNLGVGKKSGIGSLYLQKNLSIGNSIYKNADSDSKVDIKIISLQDIIKNNHLQRINFLKLDCEGSEYEILLNIDQQTLQKIDRIVSEMHPKIKNFKIDDVKKFLMVHGFEVKIIHPLNDVSKELSMLYAKKILLS
mgnify:CR=1 FL=1